MPDSQQPRQVFGTCIGKRNSSMNEDTNPLCVKGFASENSPIFAMKSDTDEYSIGVTANAPSIDSNQLIDENCHHEGHKAIFAGAASVGKMIK